MCGIAGALDSRGDRAAQRVRLLNAAQEHRGPDHQVVTRVGQVTLGNTRLAITDPTPAGNQPFVSADGRYTCVFNGEIYNHRRLVERYGLPVRTGCDGEVIPHLWAKLGMEALAEFRGMYAIALWDSLAGRLYLARDPFGIKPLHWRVLPDRSLVFASEIRALARVAPGARIDPAAVAWYLRLGAVAADQSPFREIKALPPNRVAIFSRDGLDTIRPILPDGPLGSPAVPEDLGTALVDAIDLHLGADVPTALLLSSGVDSATICAVSRRLGRDLDCLTVAAGGTADESAGAERTARRYGHRFQVVPAQLADGDVARFFAVMQRPSIDGLNTYLIHKAVHEAGFKVAVSGLGGDEVVGGYSHFRLLRYLPALRALDALPRPVAGAAARVVARAGLARGPKAARLLCREGPRDGVGLVLLQRELLPAPLVAALSGVDHLEVGATLPAAAGWPRGSFGAMAAAEVVVYLQAMLLADADAFSMASSVELRVPFVNPYVFYASLAAIERMRTRPGKALLGTALGDPYLRDLAAAAKRGFSVPMRAWLDGPLAPVLEAASDPGAAVWSVVDRAAARRAGLIPLRPRDRWAEPWALAALNAWLESLHAEQGQKNAQTYALAAGRCDPAANVLPAATARGAAGSPGRPGPAGRVLMLAPSQGLGGGIERYLDTVEWAFAARGTPCQRVNLSGSGMSGAARMLAAGRAALRPGTEPTRLVVGHRALLPVAALLAREPSISGMSVLCYGSDVWHARHPPRRILERRLMRHPGTRMVAISGFTAGALALDRPATVLPPALSAEWFATLAAAGQRTAALAGPEGGLAGQQGGPRGARLATAFRLADWRDKGLPELVNAVVMLGVPGVSLSVCGSGEPPPGLLRLVRQHPWCQLRAALSDGELAAELAAADLFVLATRTRAGRRACGEGFGLVLLEAQAAGTPVIAPAQGGSHDAYVEGVTGAAPADETAASLAVVLHDLLADPDRLAEMGRRGAKWAARAFAPEHYPDLVARRLL